MTSAQPVPIPHAATSGQLPVISAVRMGTCDQPARFIAIIDCGDGTPTHRYATVQLHVWPGRKTVAREGIYDLTWQEAQHSLAERAKLIPTLEVEVVVLATDTPATAQVHAFVNGQPAAPRELARVTTQVVYLDDNGEEHSWMIHALNNIGHLCPAAQQHITSAITAIAGRHGLDLCARAKEYPST